MGLIVADGIGVEKAEVEGDETSSKSDDGPKHVPHESILPAHLGLRQGLAGTLRGHGYAAPYW